MLRSRAAGLRGRAAVSGARRQRMGQIAAIPWYTYFDAAWQFKGAASLLASYTDLVGSADLSVVGAPDGWSAQNGLLCAGLTALNTGIVPASGYTLMIQFAAAAPSDTFDVLGGSQNAAGDTRFYLAVGNDPRHLYAHGGTLAVAAAVVAGNMCVAGAAGYLNGVSEGAIATGFSAAPTGAIYIGANNKGGVGAQNFCNANIVAVGIKFSTLLPADVAAAAALMAEI